MAAPLRAPRDSLTAVRLCACTCTCVALLLLLSQATTAFGAATQQTFSTPGESTFVVPAGVNRLTIVASGGQGGVAFADFACQGGSGALVSGTMAVTAGQTLYVEVGGAGGNAPFGHSSAGGANGGGNGDFGGESGGGGGASDVRSLPAASGLSPSDSRLLIAGGGGGSGGLSPVCTGGTAGAVATDGVNWGGDGGGGATLTAGGVKGTSHGCDVDTEATAGTLGAGGNGAADSGACVGSGGGAGGGRYGGGGGGAGQGGGGGGGAGSSYAAATIGSPSITTADRNVEITQPARNGAVAIDFAPAAPTAAIATPSGGGTYRVGQSVATSFSCTEGANAAGIASCADGTGHHGTTGTVSGSLDTSTAGPHTYTVTATSHSGLTGAASITYTVAAAPSATITTPARGATYAVGQHVATAFTCAAGASGPSVSTCRDGAGATSPGTLDTATAGPHTYTVTATAQDGQTGTASTTYTVAVAPSATIISPATGGVYSTDQAVATSFTCAAGSEALASCADSTGTTTTSGGAGHLDTATPGAHTYSVSATSASGLLTTTSIAYTVQVPAGDLFEDFDAGIPAGWTTVANSSPPGTRPTWFPGIVDLSSFPAWNGGPTSYAAANWQAIGQTGTISTWLISPPLSSLSNGDTWSFYTRKIAQIAPDRLEARLSTDGRCDPGSGPDSVGDFTTVLTTVNPNLLFDYPSTWTRFSDVLKGLPAGVSTGCLAFRYYVTDGGPSSTNGSYIGLDAVRLSNDVTAPSAPSVDAATSPASPSNSSTTPHVSGAAEAGSTVRLYGNAACSGTVLGSGPAGSFNAPATGITATVAANTTTHVFAKATDGSGNTSACSSSSATYVHDSVAPTTALTGQPATVSTTTSASFTFTGADPGGSGVASFLCRLDGAAPTTCTSTKTYTDLGQGSHTFTVVARDAAGNTDATLESRTWVIDSIAPATADTVDTAWHTAPVLVTLTATDAGTGVAKTYYTTGASPATPTTASAVYDPTAKPTLTDGERISYFSVDAAGNVEAVRLSGAAKVNFDTTGGGGTGGGSTGGGSTGDGNTGGGGTGEGNTGDGNTGGGGTGGGSPGGGSTGVAKTTSFALKSAKAVKQSIKLAFTLPSAGSLKVTASSGKKIACKIATTRVVAGIKAISLKLCAKATAALRKLSKNKKLKFAVVATFTGAGSAKSVKATVRVAGLKKT